MNKICLKIKKTAYIDVLQTEAFDCEQTGVIREGLHRIKAENVVVFGGGITGQAVKQILGNQFSRFIDSADYKDVDRENTDAVVIATAPIHYPVVTQTLEAEFDKEPFCLVYLFQDNLPEKIKLIVETQPRSGTHYLLDNLGFCLDWGHGTVYRGSQKENRFLPSKTNRFWHDDQGGARGYMIKTHFSNPLHYPEFRYHPVVFQVSYLFDAYYSWARLMAKGGKNYYLSSTSKEWAVLKGYIPLNRDWLNYIRNQFVIRYEDYYLCFDAVIDRLKTFLGVESLSQFARPRLNPGRIYWHGSYKDRIDDPVFEYINDAFKGELNYFWPEKKLS